MNKDKTYKVQLFLSNELQLKKYLNNLVVKYGMGNIPINKAFDFDFKWEYRTTI